MKKFYEPHYHPASLRIWHWLNALVFLGLLLTVLLRKTVLSWRTNSSIIQEKLSLASIEAPVEVTNAIAKTLRDNMWTWHVALGIALAILLVFRFIIAFKTEKLCPVGRTFTFMKRLKNVDTKDLPHARKYVGQRALYSLFYIMTLIIVVTGALLVFGGDLGFAKETLKTAKEIHEFIMPFFIFFIVVHLLGVIVAELTSDKGCVSRMINGGDK